MVPFQFQFDIIPNKFNKNLSLQYCSILYPLLFCMQFLELVYSSFILLPIKYPTSMRHDCTVFHAGLPRYQTSRHDCTVFHAGLLLSDFETWLYSIPRRSAAIRLRDTTVEYSTQVCRYQTSRHNCRVFHAGLPPSDFETRRTVFHTGLPLSDFETWLYSIPHRSAGLVIVNWL